MTKWLLESPAAVVESIRPSAAVSDTAIKYRSVFIAAVGNAASPAAVLVTSPIFARVLGVSERGELAAATAPLILCLSLGTMGLPEAVTYFSSRNSDGRRQRLFLASVVTTVVGLLLTGLVILSASALSAGIDRVSRLVSVTALALVPSLLVGLARADAMSAGQWRRIAIERVLAAGIRVTAVAVLAVTNRLTVTSAAIAIAGSTALGGASYIRRFASEAEPAACHRTSLRSLSLYGVRAWVGSVAGIILSRLVQVITLPLSDARQAGFYAVAANVGDVPLIVISSVGIVLFASDAGRQDDTAVTRASRATFLVSCLVALIASSTVWIWFGFLFGPDFRGAIVPAVVLMAAAAFGAPGSIAGTALGSRGRPGLRSWSLVAAATINFLLLIILVPTVGALGAAVATLVGNIVASGLNMHWLKRRENIMFRAMLIPRARDWRGLALVADKIPGPFQTSYRRLFREIGDKK